MDSGVVSIMCWIQFSYSHIRRCAKWIQNDLSVSIKLVKINMNFVYDLFLTPRRNMVSLWWSYDEVVLYYYKHLPLTQPQMHNIHMQHSCDLNVLFHTPAGVNDDNELSLLRGVWKRQLHLPVSRTAPRSSTGQSPCTNQIRHFGCQYLWNTSRITVRVRSNESTHLLLSVRCYHLEFSPKQDLTFRWCSIQMEPLILNQLWLCKQILDRNHQRSHWLVPATRQLRCKRAWEWKSPQY